VSGSPSSVRIHYLRPPDHEEVFVQDLVHDTDEVKITLATDLDVPDPVRVHGRVVLESGSDAVWFTFPGLWHDIGRFHRADGTFTGIYSNVLTPLVFEEGGTVWRTTDLYLDVWLEPGGEISVLDEDQLVEALDRGWIGLGTAERARLEVRRILESRKAGAWPPDVVEEWTLERAREEAVQ